MSAQRREQNGRNRAAVASSSSGRAQIGQKRGSVITFQTFDSGERFYIEAFAARIAMGFQP
jgi:hypothetical protein